MKKRITVISILIALISAIVFPLVLSGCQPRDEVLKVYNWSEYIGEDVIEQFEEYYYEITGKKITVKYDLFDENELMYSQIKTTKADYDVICPSDYMVEKMIKENLLLKLANLDELGYGEIEDYRDNVSSLVMSGKSSDGYYFDYDYDAESGEYNLYSRTYMMGTLGILYANDSTAYKNSTYGTYSSMSEYVESNGWAVLWDKAYDQKIMMKNSVRDTYAIGAIYTLLNERSGEKLSDTITPSIALNATDNKSVAKIEKQLIAQKAILSGYENDEGKEIIIQGDIDLTLQWAGDAVYAMGDLQEELSRERDLSYFVPYEGSNLFSDAWCIPKYSRNITAANLWINFMCRGDIAVQNMDYIGYTSGVASQEIYDYLIENWASEEETDYCIDLAYFFGDSYDFDTVIYVEEEDYNAFEAQFPTLEIINRCAVMKDYGEQTRAMNRMWRNVKA
ncbi:MAG: ABC transporter substrate-binding protein [Clostridia bacterium]|nr:ABC transporter substrate-binding protein [Clostridia bacterium]